MRAGILAVVCVLLVNGPGRADHLLADRDVARGALLYAENCAACHGAELEGQPDWQSQGPDGVFPAPPHDATGHTWHHDSGLLFDYVAEGGQRALADRGVSGFTSGMPGFGDSLEDDEIWDILGYIRSTWPADIREMQSARSGQH